MPPSSTSPAHVVRLPALTGLRGVAAIWVALFHMFQPSELPVVELGYSGVDIFFILSGFVLSHVYIADPDLAARPGYVRFLMVRLARIYPLHLFALCCLLLLVVALPGFGDGFSEPGIRFSVDAFIANLMLVQQFVSGRWNIPAWSLGAEWMAYLAFPFLLIPIRRMQRTAALVATACLALALMAGILYAVGYTSTDVWGRFGMVRMAGEFSAGCLLYAAMVKGWRLPGLAGSIVMAASFVAGIWLPTWFPLLILSFALLIVLAAQPGNIVSIALGCKPVVLLGEISYSLYMIHWIVLHVSLWAMATVFHIPYSVWSQLVILAIAFGLSVLTYHAIERPARAWGRRLALRMDLTMEPVRT